MERAECERLQNALDNDCSDSNIMNNFFLAQNKLISSLQVQPINLMQKQNLID